MGGFLSKLFKASVEFISARGGAQLREVIKDALKSFAEWLYKIFDKLTTWLGGQYHKQFTAFVTALGLGGAGYFTVQSFMDLFNGVKGQFGLIAQTFHIDQAFNSINSLLTPTLSVVTTSSFNDIIIACGLPTAINLFLNNVAIALLIWLFVKCLTFFVSLVARGLAGLIAMIPK